jgi:hypothetical protein
MSIKRPMTLGQRYGKAYTSAYTIQRPTKKNPQAMAAKSPSKTIVAKFSRSLFGLIIPWSCVRFTPGLLVFLLFLRRLYRNCTRLKAGLFRLAFSQPSPLRRAFGLMLGPHQLDSAHNAPVATLLQFRTMMFARSLGLLLDNVPPEVSLIVVVLDTLQFVK